MGGSTAFKNRPLWYAKWNGQNSHSKWGGFGGWREPAIKQTRGDTHAAGVSVDLNWSKIPYSQIQDPLKKTSAPTPNPAPAPARSPGARGSERPYPPSIDDFDDPQSPPEEAEEDLFPERLPRRPQAAPDRERDRTPVPDKSSRPAPSRKAAPPKESLEEVGDELSPEPGPQPDIEQESSGDGFTDETAPPVKKFPLGLPKLGLPSIRIPKPNLRLPEIKVPKLKLPTVVDLAGPFLRKKKPTAAASDNDLPATTVLLESE